MLLPSARIPTSRDSCEHSFEPSSDRCPSRRTRTTRLARSRTRESATPPASAVPEPPSPASRCPRARPTSRFSSNNRPGRCDQSPLHKPGIDAHGLLALFPAARARATQTSVHSRSPRLAGPREATSRPGRGEGAEWCPGITARPAGFKSIGARVADSVLPAGVQQSCAPHTHNKVQLRNNDGTILHRSRRVSSLWCCTRSCESDAGLDADSFLMVIVQRNWISSGGVG